MQVRQNERGQNEQQIKLPPLRQSAQNWGVLMVTAWFNDLLLQYMYVITATKIIGTVPLRVRSCGGCAGPRWVRGWGICPSCVG